MSRHFGQGKFASLKGLSLEKKLESLIIGDAGIPATQSVVHCYFEQACDILADDGIIEGHPKFATSLRGELLSIAESLRAEACALERFIKADQELPRFARLLLTFGQNGLNAPTKSEALRVLCPGELSSDERRRWFRKMRKWEKILEVELPEGQRGRRGKFSSRLEEALSKRLQVSGSIISKAATIRHRPASCKNGCNEKAASLSRTKIAARRSGAVPAAKGR